MGHMRKINGYKCCAITYIKNIHKTIDVPLGYEREADARFNNMLIIYQIDG